MVQKKGDTWSHGNVVSSSIHNGRLQLFFGFLLKSKFALNIQFICFLIFHNLLLDFFFLIFG